MRDILYPFRRLHGFIHDKQERYKKRNVYKKLFRKNPKTVFLVLTPEHGNLGDHAIALAEKELLLKNHIDYIEITDRQVNEMRRKNELNILDGFPILINGGGNIGTLWPNVEMAMRDIIEQNPKSSIALLPNTAYFEKTDQGTEEFNKTINIYKCHKQLHLYLREKISYSLFKNVCQNVKLIPDMVLSLNRCNNNVQRHGCLLCLRGDREKTLTEKDSQFIKEEVSSLFNDVYITDMVVSHNIVKDEREEELEKKFDQVRSAELVVTDRLHGMIFATITGTPCVVVDSKSPKLRGCYEWIKNLDYIRFADNPMLIIEEYKKIPCGEHKCDNSHLLPYYEELKNDIIQLTSKGKT